MANVQDVTDSNFEAEVLKSSLPVLVDFWAPWCAPCRMLAPVVGQLATENAGTIKVAKMNIDESPNIASSLGISAIPTVMVFKDGQVVDRFIGVQPKHRLQSSLDQAKGDVPKA